MSDEQEQLPDWLLSMRGESLDEPPAPQQEVELPPLESPPLWEEAAVPPAEPLFRPLVEDTEAAEEQDEEPESEDMVDLLRDMVQSEEDADDYVYGGEAARVSGVIPGMKPWQSLVLAGLFFLDVAVCGCMALTMLGRIEF